MEFQVPLSSKKVNANYIKTFRNETELKIRIFEDEIAKEAISLSSLPLNNSLRDKLKHIYSLINEKKKVEEPTKTIKVKKQPTAPSKKIEEKPSLTKEEETEEELKQEDVKTLHLLIKEIEELRRQNPLKVSEKALDEDSSEQYLNHLKSLLTFDAMDSWKRSIDYVRQQILRREEAYNFWIRSLWPFLNRLQQGHDIKGIILNLYSRRDICHSCTVRLARECEYNAGFAIKLKSMVSSIVFRA